MGHELGGRKGDVGHVHDVPVGILPLGAKRPWSNAICTNSRCASK